MSYQITLMLAIAIFVPHLHGSDNSVVALLSLERGLKEIALTERAVSNIEWLHRIAQYHLRDFRREKQEFEQHGAMLPLTGAKKNKAQRMLQQIEGLIIQLAELFEGPDVQGDVAENQTLMRQLLQARRDLISIGIEGVGLGFCEKCKLVFGGETLGLSYCGRCSAKRVEIDA